MAFCLFGGRAPWDAQTADPTEWRLGRLMEEAFPGYEKVLGPRFPASVLLIKHSRRVDDALVEAAWRYSKLLGPKVFAVGLREWPPSDAWKPAEVASGFQRTEPAPKSRRSRQAKQGPKLLWRKLQWRPTKRLPQLQ